MVNQGIGVGSESMMGYSLLKMLGYGRLMASDLQGASLSVGARPLHSRLTTKVTQASLLLPDPFYGELYRPMLDFKMTVSELYSLDDNTSLSYVRFKSDAPMQFRMVHPLSDERLIELIQVGLYEKPDFLEVFEKSFIDAQTLVESEVVVDSLTNHVGASERMTYVVGFDCMSPADVFDSTIEDTIDMALDVTRTIYAERYEEQKVTTEVVRDLEVFSNFDSESMVVFEQDLAEKPVAKEKDHERIWRPGTTNDFKQTMGVTNLDTEIRSMRERIQAKQNTPALRPIKDEDEFEF